MKKRTKPQKRAEEQNEMFQKPTVANLHDSDILASLSAFARAFGTDRETLRRCLLEHDVEPSGERAGHKLYALRHAYEAWTATVENVDPDKLKPFQRKAWYQGDREKLNLQLERGQLVDAAEMERTIGRLNQLFVRGLETLEDVIERDCGLNPQQASTMQRHADQLREELYKLIAGEDIDEELTDAPPEVPVTKTPPELPIARPPVERPVSRETGSAVDDGIRFLQAELAKGPRPTAELLEAGKKVGLSETTLRRAKAQLGKGIAARKQGRGWVWQLV